ncbi:NAD-dependent epimerase/dehydratase family protein [Streptomyces sp. XHT-2]|uniref:NAD-dependent epimerase/dehydratase family protein n=1 Tax=Streptomyces sp. XHT-2 TaxID=2692621 RepID=UPI00136FCCD4|nr:NAD-dependent epimerase/dehydratase family protein [Streptomyces sp. XHT-2]WSB45831.1 SDR family oxidoreductase [Streptomyces cellulosae]WSB51909.1 SDR family oxidoreductase [Streptomyces cellulosae]WUC40377.1 SDR family oxidoreductase [Streptomyces cellulosae]
MRVFVTGASGHLGSAVVPELVRSGHQVVGLARSDTSAAALSAAGVQVHRGDLDDPAGLAAAAAAADGVIHLAFKHDAMAAGDYEGAVAADLRGVEALGHALAGTGKPLVGTSGTLGFAGLGRILIEADTLGTGPRVDAENAVVALAERGIRSSVVRLTPTVHSALDHHGFIPALISVARRSGVAAYVGDGANRWPAVHTLDAARLYRLALESAPAGARLHAVGDEQIPFRRIAEVIGRRLGLPVAGIEAAQAEAYFGFLAAHVQADNPSSSVLTQDLLGWKPVGPGLVEDLALGHYFDAPASAGA